MDATTSDFIPAKKLARLIDCPDKTIYNQHSTGTGPFKDILVKVGGRLGVFRRDYDRWLESQLRTKAPEQQRAA